MRRAVSLAMLVAVLAVPLLPSGGSAAVEGEVLATLPLEAAPLDVAVSADGRWTFVLMKGGEVRIYGADGEFQGTLRVEDGANGIAASPQGDRLFVSGRGPDRVDVVSVDFVHPIDVAGSPFKGPADAPVVVAVYNDFQ